MEKRNRFFTVLVNGTEHNDKTTVKKLPFYARTMEQNSELYFVSYYIL